MKHTPGPWEVDSGMVQTVGLRPFDTMAGPGLQHTPIAYMDRESGNGTMPTERDANARLIAAAPDLLEALKDAICWIDVEDKTCLIKAQAAIAKAEGTVRP